MAEQVTREIVHDKKSSGSVVAWLALLVAIAALTLAWLAYNRSGQDLEDRIQRQIDQSINNSGQ